MRHMPRSLARRSKTPFIDGWMSELDGDRLEIYLKVANTDADRKIRASGPREEMFELVSWFEERTGLRFDHPKWRDRVRRGPRPIAGQAAFPELSSDATVAADG